MKYIITVEVMNGDRPLKAKDLKGQIVAKFPRVAPKLFQKTIRTVCWPFDANVKVEFVEEQDDGRDQPDRPKKQKRKGKRRRD